MKWLNGKRGKIHPLQTKVMRQAGFRLSSKDLSIVVWRRGDIRIGLGPQQKISLKELVGRVVRQAEYWTAQKAKIVWGSVCDWNPSKENK